MFVIFPLIELFLSQPDQPKIINGDKIEQESKISMGPESEIKMDEMEQK